MLSTLIIVLAALGGAFLSFFCGFGLGTILLPAFMIFFPAPAAIAATAVVHMANNVFKLFLVGKHAHWPTVRRFGIASVAGAVVGAWAINWLSNQQNEITFTLAERVFQTDIIRIVIGIIILLFALLELSPSLDKLAMPSRWLPFGGLISGFFGGLSGHQGALRSAFLMRTGLSKNEFMGTRVICACLVDVSRISVYATSIAGNWQSLRTDLLVIATLAAFGGAWTGNKLIQKTELAVLNKLITAALIIFAVAFGIGLI
jgi:uncharacterized membrane protein YfcA